MVRTQNSVLIVDADKKSREALALNFEKIDWIVYTADNGVSATQSVHRDDPDIIIMDILFRAGMELQHAIL